MHLRKESDSAERVSHSHSNFAVSLAIEKILSQLGRHSPLSRSEFLAARIWSLSRMKRSKQYHSWKRWLTKLENLYLCLSGVSGVEKSYAELPFSFFGWAGMNVLLKLLWDATGFHFSSDRPFSYTKRNSWYNITHKDWFSHSRDRSIFGINAENMSDHGTVKIRHLDMSIHQNIFKKRNQ